MSFNIVIGGPEKEVKQLMTVVKGISGLSIQAAFSTVDTVSNLKSMMQSKGKVHIALLHNRYTAPNKEPFSDAIQEVCKQNGVTRVGFGHEHKAGKKGNDYDEFLEMSHGEIEIDAFQAIVKRVKLMNGMDPNATKSPRKPATPGKTDRMWDSVLKDMSKKSEGYRPSHISDEEEVPRRRSPSRSPSYTDYEPERPRQSHNNPDDDYYERRGPRRSYMDDPFARSPHFTYPPPMATGWGMPPALGMGMMGGMQGFQGMMMPMGGMGTMGGGMGTMGGGMGTMGGGMGTTGALQLTLNQNEAKPAASAGLEENVEMKVQNMVTAGVDTREIVKILLAEVQRLSIALQEKKAKTTKI